MIYELTLFYLWKLVAWAAVEPVAALCMRTSGQIELFGSSIAVQVSTIGWHSLGHVMLMHYEKLSAVGSFTLMAIGPKTSGNSWIMRDIPQLVLIFH